jgi:hypothetical protein
MFYIVNFYYYIYYHEKSSCDINLVEWELRNLYDYQTLPYYKVKEIRIRTRMKIIIINDCFYMFVSKEEIFL